MEKNRINRKWGREREMLPSRVQFPQCSPLLALCGLLSSPVSWTPESQGARDSKECHCSSSIATFLTFNIKLQNLGMKSMDLVGRDVPLSLYYVKFYDKNKLPGTSLVEQWIRIDLPVQEA